MPERIATVSKEVDPNSSEEITQEVMSPEGGRAFHAQEPGVSEDVHFRMTEHQLMDGSFPDTFAVQQNESGEWVIVSDDPEEEPWVIPKGIEFTIGIQGATMRLQEDINVLPFNPYGNPSPIPGRMADQARNSGAGHPKLSFYVYDTKAGGQSGATLIMQNFSREDVPLEVHTRTEVLPDESPTQVISAEFIAANDPRPEQSQEVMGDSPDIEPEIVVQNEHEPVEEAKDVAVNDLTVEAETFAGEIEEAAIASHEANSGDDDTLTTAETTEESLLPETGVGTEEAKEDPLAGLSGSLRMAVRLGSVTREEALEQAAADQQKEQDEKAEEARRQERYALDRKLTLAEAVDRIAGYANDCISTNDKAVHEAIHDPEGGLLALLRKASQQNESIEGSGVLDAVNRLKSKVTGYSEDLNDLGKQVKEYIEASEHDRSLERTLEVITGNKTEVALLRDDTVDAMETVRDDLAAAKDVNDGVLEYLVGLESDLTNGVPTTYVNQPALSFGGVVDSKGVLVREAIDQASVRLKNMGGYMSSERDAALQKVRSAIATLETFGSEAKK